MRNPKAQLQLEELGSRVLPSASPFLIDLPDGPAHSAGHDLAHRGVHTPAAARFDGLDGTLGGSVTPAMGIPDGGAWFSLQGSGKLGGLDKFTVTGFLHSVGFLAKGHATGDLTLTNSHGTIKLNLEGPEQAGFSHLPSSFHFTVTGATGAYKNLHDDGEVSLQMHKHGNSTTFALVFA